MILELDCGNTFIKWRLSDPLTGEATLVRSAENLRALLASLAGINIARVRLASVRSEQETGALILELGRQLNVEVLVARSGAELAGVVNGYQQPERLGVDRWLALVAAYNLRMGACVVIDLGTAVTVDFVDDAGRHQGGYICPGFGLMISQLIARASGVRAEPSLCRNFGLQPGRNTQEALERGCLHMLRAYVESQVIHARQMLGEQAGAYVTGGDAELVADTAGVCHVRDLVFQGLALACP